MTPPNLLATLAEYHAHATPRGQTVTTDATDDAQVYKFLDDAARDAETQCHRTFYPRYETRWFDVPVYINSPRELFLDDDLLEVVKVTNGDGNEVLSTVYNLKPKNYSPHYAIQMIGPTSVFWIFNGIGNIEKVISVEGWWGFHNRYEQRAWTQVGTLGAAMASVSTLQFTLTTGHSLVTDSIIKIDTEILNINTIGTTSMTANQRGDNGSTAATHLISAPVYVWNVVPDIKVKVLQKAEKYYQERLGGPGKAKYDDPDYTGYVRPL